MKVTLYDTMLKEEIELPRFIEHLVLGSDYLKSDIVIPKKERNKKNLEYVSGSHCILERIGSDLVVYDNKSKNGTRVNGKLIDSSLGEIAKNGYTLALGPYNFEVRIEEEKEDLEFPKGLSEREICDKTTELMKK
jgi:pSer/pThr/pTyr-binding forkhead associated (FHA) protein